jgi:hypothetical protein
MYNLLLEKGLNVKYVLLDNNETLFSGTPEEYKILKVKLEK